MTLWRADDHRNPAVFRTPLWGTVAGNGIFFAESLRGEIATGDICPFARASATALARFNESASL